MINVDHKRSQCPLANGLEIIGDKWTLLIIRDLILTNRCKFKHFLQAGEGISTNILSERLERLQCSGLISKSTHAAHSKKNIYSLTEQGLKLAPTIIELTLWANKSINDTTVPKKLLDMMQNKRSQLLKMIASRTPLIVLDL